MQLHKLRPIVKYSDKTLDAFSWFFKVGGIALFPFVILREKYRDSSEDFWRTRNRKVINHESIHFQQALELLVIPFYFLYVLEWFVKLFIYRSKAYQNISFEREAYANDGDLNYLSHRKRYNWIKRILR